MIEAVDLHRWYGRTHAVRGVTLGIESRQIVGILGPNGAGKSTLIRMLTGVLRPHRGSISLDGVDALAEPIRARRGLGYLPESAAVYSEMSVRQYLRHRAALLGQPLRQRTRAVQAAMERCRIADVAGRRLGTLSKGYRQRAALAGAIVNNPRVLVLDEPTNGLDPSQLREARSLIGELAHDRTVLICSHILGEIERLCARVVIIAGGRVLADGPIHRLRALSEHGCIAEVRGPVERLQLPPGLSLSREDMGEGWSRLRVAGGDDAAEVLGRAAAGAGLELRRLTPQGGTLEDTFVTLLDQAGRGANHTGAAAGVPDEALVGAQSP
jgi:ABC-2 type transport system ATP-binding protein